LDSGEPFETVSFWALARLLKPVQCRNRDRKGDEVKRRTIMQGLAIAALAGTGAQSPAQGRSDGRLTLMVPYPAGGGMDLLARFTANHLEEGGELQVTVENAPGANGIIAAQKLVQSARPDSSLIVAPAVLQTTVREINPHLLPFDPDVELRTVSVLAVQKYVLVARMEFDARAFLTRRWAPADPVPYGATGVGGMEFLTARAIESTISRPLNIISYKGLAEIRNAMLAGDIQMAMVDEIVAVQLVESRKVQAVAALSSQPCILFPDLPLAREVGLGKLNVDMWISAYSSARMGEERVRLLSSRFDALRHRPAFTDGLRKLGMQHMVLTGAPAQQYARSEQQRVRTWIREFAR
jgi:tripartite-type tricarboxylate transporter receptor subunit TctC